MMSKKILNSFLLFSLCGAQATSHPPLFVSNFVTNFFWGQNVDIFNSPFDPYSQFQYIYDFGFQIEDEPINNTNQFFSITALARFKGIFGDLGSGLVPLQETEKFEVWIRNFNLKLMPGRNKNCYFQIGYFPFKIANGFTIGTAYNINIPNVWEYTHEQLNQYRPGFVLHLSDHKRSCEVDGYVGFILPVSQNAPTGQPQGTLEAFVDDIVRELSSAHIDWENGTCGAVQLQIRPFERHPIKFQPYIFFLKATQVVQAYDDAVSNLQTGGLMFEYNSDRYTLNFEYSQNFGEQQLSAIDENYIFRLSPTYIYNTDLFYAPTVNPNVPSNLVPYSAFRNSPYVISPAVAEEYGNGGSFVYPVAPGTSYIFKNSNDRYRNAYTNAYTGRLFYLQFDIKRDPIDIRLGGVYLSGGQAPNDSLATIFFTKFAPNVRYKDYNKNYKSFVGISQFTEAGNLGGIYFGPGIYRLTNLAALSASVYYTPEEPKLVPYGSFAWVTYFKPFAPILDVVDETGTTNMGALPHYLGTELNGKFSMNLAPHFKFLLASGFFFPGSIYQQMKDQLTVYENTISAIIDGAQTPIQETPTQKVAFFVKLSVEWRFDSADIERALKKWLS